MSASAGERGVLAALVGEQMGDDPFCGTVFIGAPSAPTGLS
jgi:hypothetical protein